MAGLHRHADLAVGLEAADAGAVAGARVDDDEGPLQRVDVDAFGRNDSYERVIDRALEPAAVEHDLGLVVEQVGGGWRGGEKEGEYSTAAGGFGNRMVVFWAIVHPSGLKAGSRRVGHPALVRGRQGSPRVRRLSTTPSAFRPSCFDIDYIVNLTD